jgi:allophanate hydrolase subunit 1
MGRREWYAVGQGGLSRGMIPVVAESDWQRIGLAAQVHWFTSMDSSPRAL